MSYADGMAAMNLEFSSRVPRTEFSACHHWELVKTVTGIDVSSKSNEAEREKARIAFMKEWNYDFVWNVLIHNQIYDGKYTKMGHAVYATDGEDYDTELFQYFTEPEDVLKFDFDAELGQRDIKQLTRDFNNNYADVSKVATDAVNTSGIYVTLMSGLIEMLGWDMLLLTAGIYPEEFGDFTNRYAKWMQQYFEALAETDFPVVKIHDDIVWTAGAFLNPEWYRKYIFPNYKKYFAPLIESGKKIIYTCDGNFSAFIDDIADSGVNGFIMEPLTDMKYIAEKYGKTHVFVGNADTNVLLRGTKEDIYNEVKRCMDIGKSCPGFFMAVGNHIPSNTPIENALYYNECYEKLGRR